MTWDVDVQTQLVASNLQFLLRYLAGEIQQMPRLSHAARVERIARDAAPLADSAPAQQTII